MSDGRREAQRKGGYQTVGLLVQHTGTALRHREFWKYVELDRYLRECGRQFEFEFRIGAHVIDLVLLDTKVAVEFDGPYHASDEQRYLDRQRDADVAASGFRVVRFPVKASSVIPSHIIKDL